MSEDLEKQFQVIAEEFRFYKTLGLMHKISEKLVQYNDNSVLSNRLMAYALIEMNKENDFMMEQIADGITYL